MSPIPPNKENTSNNKQPSVDLEEDLVGNQEEELQEAVETLPRPEDTESNQYRSIPDAETAEDGGRDEKEDSDESDEDEDDDSEPELDPEVHFELLASSRAGGTGPGEDKAKKAATNDMFNYSHQFDTDVFERKNVLEPEEIHLDSEKSKLIQTSMAGFSLPQTSIPDWAKLVPENVWKKSLMDSLNAKKIDLFKLDNENK
jgi:hypothetical protein